jgi:predicted DNA-binding ribbon-helix-helix protein
VHHLQTFYHIRHDPAGILESVHLVRLIAHISPEVPSIAILKHNIYILVSFMRVMVLDYILTVELLHHLNLVVYISPLFTAHMILIDLFHCPRVALLVGYEVDIAEPSSA